MSRHVQEALLVGLALLAAIPLATKREIVVLLSALSVVAFIVGLVLILNNA